MNIFRIMAIILPMTLLLACVVTEEEKERRERFRELLELGKPPPPTVPSGPPAPPSIFSERPLPSFMVANVSAAQIRFGGSEPAITNEALVVSAIRTKATLADSLLFTGARPTGSGTIVTPTCSNESCSFDFPGIKDLVFSLDDPEDLSLVDDGDLFGYNSRTAAVMIDEGVTLFQSRAAARQDDDTRLAFQSYGGWLGDYILGSVFGLERIAISEGGTTTSRDAAFSFGDLSGTNPTGTGRAMWRGVFIGIHAGNHRISQGIAEIDIDDFASPSVDLIVSGVLDINSRSQVSASAEWHDMPLTNGTFHHNNTAVMGSFYERDHEEVGGVVNDRGWIGAFGGTRQPTP